MKYLHRTPAEMRVYYTLRLETSRKRSKRFNRVMSESCERCEQGSDLHPTSQLKYEYINVLKVDVTRDQAPAPFLDQLPCLRRNQEVVIGCPRRRPGPRLTETQPPNATHSTQSNFSYKHISSYSHTAYTYVISFCIFHGMVNRICINMWWLSREA